MGATRRSPGCQRIRQKPFRELLESGGLVDGHTGEERHSTTRHWPEPVSDFAELVVYAGEQLVERGAIAVIEPIKQPSYVGFAALGQV